MSISRTGVAAGLLAVGAGLAVLGILLHHDFTAMYGDVTSSGPQEFARSLVGGVSALPLVLAGLVSLIAASVSPRRWIRLAAVAIPVVMVAGMVTVISPALRDKLESQYDATPRCVSDEDMGPGPGSRAAQESQQAFESIEHIGLFGGGGSSGVGGCDRSFVLTEEADVLGHYRSALAAAGWRVVEDDGNRLRAERDGMAFELVTCDRGGVVWAGRDGDRGGAGCHPQ